MNYEKLIHNCENLCTLDSPIQINQAKLQQVAKAIKAVNAPNWDWELPPALRVGKVTPENAFEIAHYLFLTTAINFCYWTNDSGNFQHWCYEGNPNLKGSSGMAHMMMEIHGKGGFPSVNTNPALLLPYFLSEFEAAKIPYAEERASIITSMADARKFRLLFNDSYDVNNNTYTFDTAMAWRLGQNYFEAYADTFLKKSQLLLGMLTANFKARGWDVKTELTAYADYRIPQVLRHLGVLEYSNELTDTIDNGKLIVAGSSTEKFIRAASIIACKKISNISNVSEAVVDAYLFTQTRDNNFVKKAKPFHLCITTDY